MKLLGFTSGQGVPGALAYSRVGRTIIEIGLDIYVGWVDCHIYAEETKPRCCFTDYIRGLQTPAHLLKLSGSFAHMRNSLTSEYCV